MWFAKDGSKAWAEKFFLFVNLSSLILFLVVFIGSGLYERYDDRVSYAVVSGLMVLPNIVVPVVLVGKSDKVLPWYTRFVWKANMWNLVFGFIGNYFWTHYFYKILGARYTFDTFRLNDVPIPCYLATHVYFLFYHSVSSITLRKLDEATTKLPTPLRRAIFACGVLMLAYLTAYMETLTISAFPYYEFVDRDKMQSVGSWLYAIYFIVSFPMFLRIDEDPKRRWTISEATLDSFSAAMIVTLMLDFWRLFIGPIVDTGAFVVGSDLPFL